VTQASHLGATAAAPASRAYREEAPWTFRHEKIPDGSGNKQTKEHSRIDGLASRLKRHYTGMTILQLMLSIDHSPFVILKSTYILARDGALHIALAVILDHTLEAHLEDLSY
jgi:hypothetical protein